MPLKIQMRLSNGNPTPSQIANFNSKNVLPTPLSIPTSLKSSMISRIHNVKPGCGGCGRH
jgi:hypothetical protein